jgi:hypothetical protein
MLVLESQFDVLAADLSASLTSDQLNRPLSAWVRQALMHLPQFILKKRTGDFCRSRFSALAGKEGIGPRRLLYVIEFLRRIRDGVNALETAPETSCSASDEIRPSIQFDSIRLPAATEADRYDEWDIARQTIKGHGLAFLPIGRCAIDLKAIPRHLWYSPFSAFLDMTSAEMRQLPAFGRHKTAAVVQAAIALSRLVATPLAAELQPVPPICLALAGVNVICMKAMISKGQQPTEDAAQLVADALLTQLQHDVGSDVAAAVRSCVLQDLTLQKTSELSGVSREMIRQRLALAAEVIGVRWPEGEGLLTVLALRIEPTAPAMLILARILKELYGRTMGSFEKLTAIQSSEYPRRWRPPTLPHPSGSVER